MKKWLRRLLIAAALAGLTFGILYECATHVGRGWLFGEAFFEGRPTSYWRKIVRRDLHIDARSVKRIDLIYPPTPNAWDRCRQLMGYRVAEYLSLKLVKSLEADQVLAQLASDKDAKIAGFANEILAEVRNRDPWDDRFNTDDLCWKALVRKHNLQYVDAQ